MKIIKALINIYLGFWGIIKNKALSFEIKLQLFRDLIRCIILVITSRLYTKNYFLINTFKYKVFFPNAISFLYQFNEIFCKNVYPPHKRLRFIIDAGANIGMATLWLKLFSPDAEFLLFEPDIENIKYLKKNIKENNLKKLKIISKAISNKISDSVYFYKIKDNIQNLDSGLRLNQKLPYEKYFIKTTKLSGYIKSKVDLLKIDIEGSEYKVFNDLIRNNKLKYIKNIVLEAHFFNRKEKALYDKLSKYLRSIGTFSKTENSEYTCINYFKNNLK